MKDNGMVYKKVFDGRRKLFGVRVAGVKGWYIEPQFEELECVYTDAEVWFKQDGKYGLYDLAQKRVVIPAEYGYPLFFNREGMAITWQNYKAGVIDHQGNVLIPFIYDEIEFRYQRVPIPEEERPIRVTPEGETLRIGPLAKDVFRGFACFTNRGESQAYDESCRPGEFYDWEQERLNCGSDAATQEELSVAELEDEIRKEYALEHEDNVKSLLRRRMRLLNSGWEHTMGNAARIGRVNELLMRAVRKAIRLGRKTAKSLEWMEHVGNTQSFTIGVFVLPQWTDSKSDFRYTPTYHSPAREREHLEEEQAEISDNHIWNIIAAIGVRFKFDGTGVCFWHYTDGYDPAEWNVRELTGDDGHSWDENISLPAYQDVYFTRPFSHLLNDFDYAFEDLCNINDFRVKVEVHLRTREQDPNPIAK